MTAYPWRNETLLIGNVNTVSQDVRDLIIEKLKQNLYFMKTTLKTKFDR